MNNFLTCLRQELKLEWHSKERLLSPMVFSLIVLIIFAFCFADVPEDFQNLFFVAMLSLTLFFALQIYLSRSFEAEMEDDAFDLLRISRLPVGSWYFAKLFTVIFLCVVVVLPVALFGSVILNSPLQLTQIVSLCFYLALGCVGISSLGILLAAITARTTSQKIIFPILFFPLTIPVILALVYGGLQMIQKSSFATSNWIYLLVAFDTIYVTLGWLLFFEVFSDEIRNDISNKNAKSKSNESIKGSL